MSKKSSTNYVLRSVFMDPVVDEYLRAEGFRRGVSKNELIRRYILEGMRAVERSGQDLDLSTPEQAPYSADDERAVGALKNLFQVRQHRTSFPSYEPPEPLVIGGAAIGKISVDGPSR